MHSVFYPGPCFRPTQTQKRRRSARIKTPRFPRSLNMTLLCIVNAPRWIFFGNTIDEKHRGLPDEINLHAHTLTAKNTNRLRQARKRYQQGAAQ